MLHLNGLSTKMNYNVPNSVHAWLHSFSLSSLTSGNTINTTPWYTSFPVLMSNDSFDFVVSTLKS